MLCFESLRLFCRNEIGLSFRGVVSNADFRKLKDELEKLFLWGEAFKDGKLDRALEMDDESRISVLQLLIDIGEVIVNGMSIPINRIAQPLPGEALLYLG